MRGGPIRAGGYVICESGWELADSPAGRAALAAHEPAPVQPAAELVELDAAPAAGLGTGDVAPAGEPEAEADPGDVDDLQPARDPAGQRGRAVCPTCGKDVAVNKDGSLRKHTCEVVIDAPPPQVTFDGEE